MGLPIRKKLTANGVQKFLKLKSGCRGNNFHKYFYPEAGFAATISKLTSKDFERHTSHYPIFVDFTIYNKIYS